MEDLAGGTGVPDNIGLAGLLGLVNTARFEQL